MTRRIFDLARQFPILTLFLLPGNSLEEKRNRMLWLEHSHCLNTICLLFKTNFIWWITQNCLSERFRTAVLNKICGLDPRGILKARSKKWKVRNFLHKIDVRCIRIMPGPHRVQKHTKTSYRELFDLVFEQYPRGFSKFRPKKWKVRKILHKSYVFGILNWKQRREPRERGRV